MDCRSKRGVSGVISVVLIVLIVIVVLVIIYNSFNLLLVKQSENIDGGFKNFFEMLIGDDGELIYDVSVNRTITPGRPGDYIVRLNISVINPSALNAFVISENYPAEWQVLSASHGGVYNTPFRISDNKIEWLASEFSDLSVGDNVVEYTVRSPISLDGCQDINESGHYILMNDLLNIVSPCFRINTNNVILDGNGMTITGSGSPGAMIYAYEKENLTIKNFIINVTPGNEQGKGGIGLSYIHNSQILNNVIIGATGGIGIAGTNSRNNSIIGNKIVNKIRVNYSRGINIQKLFDSVIENNYIEGYRWGMYLWLSSNNNISNNIILNQSSQGIYNGMSPNNKFDYNTVCGNPKDFQCYDSLGLSGLGNKFDYAGSCSGWPKSGVNYEICSVNDFVLRDIEFPETIDYYNFTGSWITLNESGNIVGESII